MHHGEEMCTTRFQHQHTASHRGRKENSCKTDGKTRREIVTTLHSLKCMFLKDDSRKYFLLVELLKPRASLKGSWIPFS